MRCAALLTLLAALAAAAVLPLAAYATDDAVVELGAETRLFETFSPGWESRWVQSEDEKYTGRFVAAQPEGWSHQAIKVPEKSRHYGIASVLPEPVDPSAGFVVQYAVKFDDGITCGGAYVKLLTSSSGFKASQLKDDTPYTIMFGPDKCGNAGKVHLIVRHENLLNGTVSEHHLVDPPTPVADKETHLYTLQINADESFEIWIDGESKAKGSMFDKFEPPIVPPKTIPDPLDTKPADWVDNKQMPDPDAVRPEDWDERKEVPDMDKVKPSDWLEDEPDTLPDTAAKQPAEWDEEEDGQWAAPLIPNPKCKKAGCGPWTQPSKPNPQYKGPWAPPLISNPDFKGPWKQKIIPNPHYYKDDVPLQHIGKIGALALEIWTIDEGYTFGGFLIADDREAADEYLEKVFKPLNRQEKKGALSRAEAEAAERQKLAEKHAPKEDTISSGIVASLSAALEHPSLGKVKPFLEPALEILNRNPGLVYLLMSAPVIALFLFLVSRGFWSSSPKTTKPAARRVRRKAYSSSDEEDNGKPTSVPVPAETGDAVGDTEPVIAPPTAAAAGEISAAGEDEEEPEMEQIGATRRRVRRVA